MQMPKPIGPNGIPSLVLETLLLKGVTFLKQNFNKSIHLNFTRVSIITRETDMGKSYIPIALLSLVAKTLE